MVWSGNVRKEKCLVQFRDVKECHGIWRKGREVCLKRSGKDKCVMVNVLTVCLASLPCYLLQHSGLRRKFKCIAVRLKSVHSGFFRNHIMDFLISITVADFFFFFFFNSDSLHARLNSHYEAWSYKKKKHKKITAYRKSV